MTARLREIDALRGLAAAGVALIFHQHFLLGRYRTGPLDGLPGFTWFHDYGWTMVDLFFVISGFIFAHVYLTDGRMNATIKDFTRARFARLYPLHLVALCVAGIVLAFGLPATGPNIRHDAWHFLLNLLMLQESGLNDGNNFNMPAWSISVECMCYAVFCLVASRYPKALIPLAIAFVIVGFAVTVDESARLNHIGRGFCGFFAGVLCYRVRSVHWLFPVALIAFGAWLLPFVRGFSWGAVLGVTCWSGLVLLASRLPLRSAPLQWLGDRSYSLYLVHAPVYWAGNVFLFDSGQAPEWVIIPGIVAVLLTADLSYRYLEKPARQALRDNLHRETGAVGVHGN